MENIKFLEYGIDTFLNETEFSIYTVVSEYPFTKGEDWTSDIKDRVGQMGKERGFKVRSSNHGVEWLYDLIWFRSSDDSLQESLTLVLESELSDRPNRKTQSKLIWDFEKLLIAHAENRVMIALNEGNTNHPNNMLRSIKMFQDHCAKFKKGKNEIRLLIILIDDYESGDVVPFIIKI